MVIYTIASYLPSSHIFNVSLAFQPRKFEVQQLIMPAWLPGSYTIRDFARHVIEIKLSEESLNYYKVQKLNSYSWQVEPLESTFLESSQEAPYIMLEYQVYAWDRSVRGAHLDTTHAFMNLSCLALMVVGQEDGPHQVQITMPVLDEPANWRVATTLTPHEIAGSGFGWYSANSYDELIDHPIEMGEFERLDFIANDIPHQIIISGQHKGDSERLKEDVKKIVETHHQLFNNHPTIISPFKNYIFLLTLVSEGYGGLEHRSSTALIAARANMPRRAPYFKLSTEYKDLLSLFSHEYFHAWNIKCIKPAVFCPYNLTEPQYTEQLWAFEGITAYYDDLMLVRAGVISAADYFQMVADKITQLQTPGQTKQTLAQSSFDAWIKFYKPDENSKNSGVSYYTKGMLAAFCFDMMLRELTQDSVDLDKIMRTLWANYIPGKGLAEGTLELLLYEASNKSFAMKDLIYSALHTTQLLPLQESLNTIGLHLAWGLTDEAATVSLGIIIVPSSSQELVIQTVFDNSAAMKAGLSAKDVLVAIDGLRVANLLTLQKILESYQAGESILVHAFRAEVLMTFTVHLTAPFAHRAQVSINAQAPEIAVNRRNQWLSTPKE